MGVLIALVVIGLMAFGFFGFLFLGWASSKDAGALEREPEILNRAFDGEPVVTYRTGIGALPTDRVVWAAHSRGYRLSHETSEGGAKMLVFDLVDAERARQARREAVREIARETAKRTAQEAAKRRWESLGAVAIGVLIAIFGLVFIFSEPVGLGVALTLGGGALVLYGEILRRRAAP